MTNILFSSIINEKSRRKNKKYKLWVSFLTGGYLIKRYFEQNKLIFIFSSFILSLICNVYCLDVTNIVLYYLL